MNNGTVWVSNQCCCLRLSRLIWCEYVGEGFLLVTSDANAPTILKAATYALLCFVRCRCQTSHSATITNQIHRWDVRVDRASPLCDSVLAVCAFNFTPILPRYCIMCKFRSNKSALINAKKYWPPIATWQCAELVGLFFCVKLHIKYHQFTRKQSNRQASFCPALCHRRLSSAYENYGFSCEFSTVILLMVVHC